MEERRDVIWYEWLYQVSNIWNVKNLKRLVKTKRWFRIVKEKILWKSFVHWYNKVTLSVFCITKTFRLHRLVAQTFIPNPENKRTVNHKNWIKTDNRVDNLERCTHSENELHSYRVLWKVSPKIWSICVFRWVLGNKNPSSKTVYQYTKDWKFIREWWATMDIQRELKIRNSDISACCRWKMKYAGWFIWRYKIKIWEKIHEINLM